VVFILYIYSMRITKFLEWKGDWKSHLPKQIVLHNGQEYVFNLGNIMEPSDMESQVTYDDPTYGFPDTFEIDIYRIMVGDRMKLDVDMTCGDFMVYSFSIFDGKISLIEDSKKFWGTERYCIGEQTRGELAEFFGYVSGTNLSVKDFGFLCPFGDNR
jgi:hypothetical protein